MFSKHLGWEFCIHNIFKQNGACTRNKLNSWQLQSLLEHLLCWVASSSISHCPLSFVSLCEFKPPPVDGTLPMYVAPPLTLHICCTSLSAHCLLCPWPRYTPEFSSIPRWPRCTQLYPSVVQYDIKLKMMDNFLSWGLKSKPNSWPSNAAIHSQLCVKSQAQ